MPIDVGRAVGYLDLDTTNFTKGLKGAYKELEVFKDKTATATDKLQAVGKSMTAAGTTLLKNVTVPLTAIGAASIKAGIDFESAFTGVRKTVDATESQFEQLRKGILEMTEEMPQSASEISAIAEAAGQLGIQTENILDFTKVMVKLGDATNLSSDQAATALARFANITNMAADDYERLGSTIVALGNNFATTESEIVDMSMSIAAAGTQAGLTNPQILAIAASLSSLGLEAAGGGSAFSRVLKEIQIAVETASPELANFANVANMSAEEFKKAFEDDAAGAIQVFLEGLTDVDRMGASTTKILADLGITEIRSSDALTRLGNAHEMVANSMVLANEAWQENTALSKEAEQRYATTESQLKILRNELVKVGIELADELLPIFKDVVKWLKDIVGRFGEMSDGTKKIVVTIGLVVAALGPLMMIVGNLVTIAPKVATAFKVIAAAIGGISAPVLAVIGIIALLVAAFVNLWNKSEEFRTNITNTWERIKGIFSKFTQDILDTLNSFGFDFKNLGEVLSAIWEGFCSVLGPVFETTFENIANILELVLGVLSNLFKIWAGIFQGDWSKVWEGIKGIFVGVGNFIINGFNTMKNGIIKGCKAILQALGLVESSISHISSSGRTHGGGEGRSFAENYKNQVDDIENSNLELIKSEDETTKKLLEEYKKQKDGLEGYNKDKNDDKNNSLKETKKTNDKELKEEESRYKDLVKLNDKYTEELAKINDEYKEKVIKIKQEEKDEILKLEKQYKEDYENAINNRAKELMKSVDLFKEAADEEKEAISGKQMIKNLQNQLEDIRTWRTNLDKLMERGVTGSLLEELQEFGPEYADEIANINKLSDTELQKLIDTWNQVEEESKLQAETEIKFDQEGLDRDIQNVITTSLNKLGELDVETDKKLKELQTTYEEDLANLGLEVAPIAENTGIQIIEAMELGVEETKESLIEKLNALKDEVRDIVRDIQRSIKSVSNVADIDGSHESGLDYVPKDGYIARLHRGERVLTKQENEEYSKSKQTNTGKQILNVNFTGTMGQLIRALNPEIQLEDVRGGVSY